MKIAIALFTGVEELDALAPYEVLSVCKALGYDLSIDLISHEETSSLRAVHGLHIAEIKPWASDYDLVIVPGGAWLAGGNTGVRKAVGDGDLPTKLKVLHGQGVILASVCTGAMLLGAAGLLQGRAATTHHSALPGLGDFGAEICTERVVDDGDILSAGGVTSGLDLALWIIERFVGEKASRETEEHLEYQRRGSVRKSIAIPNSSEAEAPYDLIADQWAAARSRLMPVEEIYLKQFLNGLPEGASVLDYGCGSGHPMASRFVELGYKVTGVDGSEALLAKARQRFPDQEWLRGKLEVMELDKSFDRIICWDALFHVRREHHAAILAKIYRWLRPGGKIMLSSGGSAQEPFKDTMFGQTFFYDAHPPAEFVALVHEAGFEIEMKDFPSLPSGGRDKGKLAVIATKPL